MDRGESLDLDKTLAIVIAAAIGALAGFGGAMLNAWLQSRAERAKELRDAVQQFATKLAAGAHSMAWLCWLAKEAPCRLSQERIDQYDAEMHGLLAEISGLNARITSLNKEESAQKMVAVLAERMFKKDSEVAKVGLLFDSNREQCVTELAALYDEIHQMECEIPIASSKIMGEHNKEATTAVESNKNVKGCGGTRQ